MPTIIKLIADADSTEKIQDYLKENKLPEYNKEFHSTILYAHITPVFENKNILDKINSFLPLTITQPYSLDRFGTNDLVLKYESALVRKIEEIIIREGVWQMLNWMNVSETERDLLEKSTKSNIGTRYLEFHPHITIARNFNEDIKRLTKFTSEIVFNKTDWCIDF